MAGGAALVFAAMSLPLRLTVLAALGAALLVVASPAFAGDNGEGLAGETDDKLVTFFSLGVILFFSLVALLGTIIQGRLERRQEAKKAAAAVPDFFGSAKRGESSIT